MNRTAGEWRKLVKQYSAGLTGEQVEAVVKACLEHPDWGVWHAGAQVFGTKCHCGPCADRRA